MSLAAVLVISLMALASAQPQGGPPNARGNPLARLNRALESAGAAALDSNQQQQLKSLVSDYRAAHPRMTPDTALQAAQRDLENSILAGDNAGVTSAAGKIAAEISNRANTTIQDLAKFEVQALKTLTSEQLTALKTQLGDAGLIRMLGSLAGGGFNWRGFGRAGR